MDFNFIANYVPVVDPVYVFSIVMLSILLMPALMRKLNLPEAIGIIIAGIILGPTGLDIIEKNSSIILLGTVGIVYIMFISGLEMNINDFKKNSKKSLIFGTLTFFLPQIIGTTIAYYFMNMNILNSVLLGSIYASHTLLSYPIISKLGAKDDESVLVTIGGTLLTNSLSFGVLAVIVSINAGKMDVHFGINLILLSCLLVFISLFFIPIIARWFFKNSQGEGNSHFIFVMVIVFVSSSISKIIGLEPIIGAMLAGLAINSLIPSNSTLMNRINFIGNTLFLPFFLIYVGMLVDVRIFFSDPKTLIITLLMTIIATSTKWLAAMISKKIFNYTKDQGNIMFGLSNSQAVSTLAAVMIGYNLKIFDAYILNGTIGMMLFTCIISAIVSEKATKKLLLTQSTTKAQEEEQKEEQILVPINNPKTLGTLVDLSLLIKSSSSLSPIYPLIIVSDSENASAELKEKQKILIDASNYAAGSENITKLISRIDVNPASGIIRVEKELGISHTIMGWSERHSKSGIIFGTTLDHLLEGSSSILFVTKASLSWSIMKKIILILPENAELEISFTCIIKSIIFLASRIKVPVHISGAESQINTIKDIVTKLKINIPIFDINEANIEDYIESNIKPFEIPIIYSGRPNSLIWSPSWEKLINKVANKKENNNFIVIYSQIEKLTNTADY